MADKNPILEAKRYLDNARTILKEKAMKENDTDFCKAVRKCLNWYNTAKPKNPSAFYSG